MKIISDPKELQKILQEEKKTQTIGFVPTMGALHQGHFSLVENAKKENDICVVSLFVNPTQFNNSEDLEKYPSTFQQDIEFLKNLKVDYLFHPTFESIYPDKYQYEIIEKELSSQLCGADRPGHFNGVLTIVMKLLQIVTPHKSYFGEKDYQQLQLIKGLVDAFFIPTEIVSCPTVRDSSGLALSSRNNRLSKEALLKAKNFAQILKTTPEIDTAVTKIKKLGFDIDYIKDIENRRFAAVKIENIRLIDNVPL